MLGFGRLFARGRISEVRLAADGGERDGDGEDGV